MHAIRQRVRDKLATIDFDSGNPLLHDGYVYRMVAQHEYQHNETMLQTLQLKQGRPYAAPRGWEPPGARLSIPRGAMIEVPAGRYTVGTDDRSFAYDNERPCHDV
jgi:iron(II)-dependent oxidoreductase